MSDGSSASTEQLQGALTEREQLQVNRLLGDPSYFPIEFKRWLKDYLEGQDMQVLSSNVKGVVTKWGDETGLPIGTIIYSAGGGAGDLTTCDGSAIGRVEYEKLFERIGTSFGVGDGSTTFQVPNIPPLTGFPGPDIPAYIVKGKNV